MKIVIVIGIDELSTAGCNLSDVVTKIKIGHPTKGLVDFSASVSADLLVIGHSRHSGIWDF